MDVDRHSMDPYQRDTQVGHLLGDHQGQPNVTCELCDVYGLSQIEGSLMWEKYGDHAGRVPRTATCRVCGGVGLEEFHDPAPGLCPTCFERQMQELDRALAVDPSPETLVRGLLDIGVRPALIARWLAGELPTVPRAPIRPRSRRAR